MSETGKQSILIVDDRPENLLALETVLEDLNLNIIKANSGEEALWKLLEYDFFMIILDVQMPGMDGFETAGLIRAKEKTKTIPIIYVTAISKEQKHIVRGYEAGAVDYLFKPIDTEILKSKVRIFLELEKQKKTIEQQAEILRQTEKTLQRQHYIEIVLNKMLTISLEPHPLEETLDRILDQIISVPWLALKPTGAVFLADKKSKELVLASYKELSAGIKDLCARVPLDKCLCGKAAASGEIVFTNNIDNTHETKYEGISPHGHYCVPIKSAGKVIGVLTLCLKEGHVRNYDDDEFLRAIANVLAVSIIRKQAEKQLQYEAVHDPLTGLYNRRFFLKQLTNAVRSAKRYGHKLSVCLCDLDRFKEVNDTYGHKVGDEVLLTFSKIVKEELRSDDIPGRYGGDEFCILFNNTPADEAIVCVERIRTRFQNFFRGGKYGIRTPVSATFGLADLSPEQENEKDLLLSADQALYKAKNSGRNQSRCKQRSKPLVQVKWG